MRKAYEPIPWLASPANPPRIGAVTGLGTGGGVSLQSPIPGSGVGSLVLHVGSNPSAGGSVVLNFAQAPPLLFFSGDEDLGVITPTNQQTTSVTVSWSGRPQLRTRRRIHYEWSVSQ